MEPNTGSHDCNISHTPNIKETEKNGTPLPPVADSPISVMNDVVRAKIPESIHSEHGTHSISAHFDSLANITDTSLTITGGDIILGIDTGISSENCVRELVREGIDTGHSLDDSMEGITLPHNSTPHKIDGRRPSRNLEFNDSYSLNVSSTPNPKDYPDCGNGVPSCESAITNKIVQEIEIPGNAAHENLAIDGNPEIPTGHFPPFIETFLAPSETTLITSQTDSSINMSSMSTKSQLDPLT